MFYWPKKIYIGRTQNGVHNKGLNIYFCSHEISEGVEEFTEIVLFTIFGEINQKGKQSEL